jgi:hypothetical protein
MVKGKGISTSIIHFSEQHDTGSVPAPQTVWPPGYSSAVALLYWVGIPLELAGLWVSVVSTLLLIPTFLWGGTLLGLRPSVIRWMALFLIFNSGFSLYATSILSESLFTLLSLLALDLFLRAEVAEADGRKGVVYLFLGGIALGFDCWVRYAGYFFVAAVLLYYGLKFLTRRSWMAFKSLALAGTCIPFVLSNFLRNLALSGTLQGGNSTQVTNSFAQLARKFTASAATLLVGGRVHKDLFPGMWIVILVGMFFAAALILISVCSRRADLFPYLRRPPVLLAGAYLLFYLCALLYAGRTTVISFGDSRLLYPIYPVVLLLLCGVLSTDHARSRANQSPRFGYTLLGVGIVCYSVLNLQDIVRSSPHCAYSHKIRHAIAEPIGDCRSLIHWLDAHVPAHQPILAGDGQACGYFSGRETISLVSAEYSASTWSEDRIRQTAMRYGATILILFQNGKSTLTCAAESPFLTDLLHGAPPPWIVLEAQNSEIMIYRLVAHPK